MTKIATQSSKGVPGYGYVEVFCKYIVKNGKRIYPKNGSCFHFFVKRKK